MSRSNLRLLRGLSGATILALLAGSVLIAPALAANARQVYFGSPDGSGGRYENGDLVFGSLTNTTVSTGGRSKVDVLLRNDDGQALNHARIAGGDETASPPIAYNPAFSKPSGTSLGSASIAYFELTDGPDGATCSWDSAGFLCDIGSLAPEEYATFTIVLNAPATPGPHPYWFTASWNEGWSSTGTNADYNFAVDDLNVVQASCSNGTASWFLAGGPLGLDEGGTDPCAVSGSPATLQDSSVASVLNLGADVSGLATLKVDSSFVGCPDAYRCLGHTISASILGGDTVDGGIRWTAKWYGTKNIAGVFHFLTGYDPDIEDEDTFEVIPLTKKFKCGSTPTLTTNCWESITTSTGKAKPAWVQVIWITDGNGKGGGFY